MKVYIGPYKNYIGPYQIAEWLTTFKINGIGNEEDIVINLIEDPHTFGEWLSDTPLNDLCEWIESKRSRKVKVKIHDYDAWSMDSTLAVIILPMLKKMASNKMGAPNTDDSDVPDELKSINSKNESIWDSDSNFFKRWDYIVDEMIWAFEQIQPDNDWHEQYTIENCELDMNKYPEDEGELSTPVRWKTQGKYDLEGMKLHQDRISNGLRLFGKYYQNLWT